MSERLPVAVDAMGGDNAPKDIVEGANIAIEQFGVPVVLVGNPEMLDNIGDIPLIEASQVVEMDAEPASSVRKLKDSSIVRTAEAVRDGNASCMLSAGNTGAAMAASLLRLGRIKGVSRPSIAVALPTTSSTPTILIDCGANADCSVEWLTQFGVMGSIYSNSRWGVEEPRVGILTIGEEAGKGNAFVKEAAELMESKDWSAHGAVYAGNIEGNDLLKGHADVVVCDGFTGNVVLKSLEGAFDVLRDLAVNTVDSGQSADDMSVAFDSFNPYKIATGALLGVKGVSMITHGSSSPMTIAHAIRTADELSQNNLPDKLRSAFADM